jgi:hypothetical protein
MLTNNLRRLQVAIYTYLKWNMKYTWVCLLLLLSACAGLPHRHTGIVPLNKSNYHQIDGLYYDTAIKKDEGNTTSITSLLDIDTKPPDFCRKCYVQISAVSSKKLNITLLDGENKVKVFHGRLGKRGFVSRRMFWKVAWGPFDGYGFVTSRFYLTPKGELLADDTRFGCAGFLIAPFMVGGGKTTGMVFAKVAADSVKAK